MVEVVMLSRNQRGEPPWIPPEVQQFALNMARKLQANNHKGGWDDLNVWELFELLEGELDELADAIMHGSGQDVIDEAADVANFAMMIADLYRTAEDEK